MSFEHTHPTVTITQWTDALRDGLVCLDANPEASTITFVSENAILTVELHKSLIAALEYEKILASQPQELIITSNEFPDSVAPQLIPRINAEISVFKAQPLRDYRERMKKEFGLEVSPSDISIYLNQLGYSLVSVPFRSPSLNSKVLHQQPPREWDAYIAHVENQWKHFNIDPFTHFSKELELSIRPSVLIDASSLPPTMNGTARNVTSFLSELEQRLVTHELNWDISVIAPPAAISALGLNLPSIKWISPETEIADTYHLGISMTPVSSIEQCTKMSSLCARWLVLHLDIIALRALQFLSQNTQASSAVRLYLEQADSVVFISEFSQRDAVNYFGEIPGLDNRSTVIHQGTHFEPRSASTEATLQPYALVLGNSYPHKQVDATFQALRAAGIPARTVPQAVSDDELFSLMSQAAVLVFPSLYEGFGLPVAEAAVQGKPLIVWDTAISREVSGVLGTEKENTFCSSIEDLVEVVRSALSNTQSLSEHRDIRSLAEFNSELIEAANSILHAPVNSERLTARWKLMNLLSQVAALTEENVTRRISEQHWRTRLAKKFK
jgi:glycosyltransferase involved in cell wall biosynthesis